MSFLVWFILLLDHTHCFNVSTINHFHIFSKQLPNGKNLIYLDNASGTQIHGDSYSSISEFYNYRNSNIYRSNHHMSRLTTKLYNRSLQAIAKFIGTEIDNLLITSGATHAIQIVASSIEHLLEPGDEIIISNIEHSSNVTPWKVLSKKRNIIINQVKVNEKGLIDPDEFSKLVTKRTKLVSLIHGSSVLGTVINTEPIAEICKKNDILFMLDGCQVTPHLPVDVNSLGCDLYVSSGHKLYGPTGVGFLYISTKAFDKLIFPFNPDYTAGVSPHSLIEFQGTPPIAQAIGLRPALNFLEKNFQNIVGHEKRLFEYLIDRLSTIPNIKLYSKSAKIPIASFNIGSLSPFDIAAYLDTLAIAIRAGNHCSPLCHSALGVDYTCRASLAVYNTTFDIDALVEGLKQFQESVK